MTSKIDYSNCGFPKKLLADTMEEIRQFLCKKNDYIFHIFDQINGYVVL